MLGKPLRDFCESNAFVPQDGTEKDKDLRSHWICRMAFCRTEDDRKWFLQQETELFRHRLVRAG